MDDLDYDDMSVYSYHYGDEDEDYDTSDPYDIEYDVP